MAAAFDAKTIWGDSTTTTITLSLTLGATANGILVHVLCGSGTALPAGLTVKWDTAGANQSFTQVPSTLVSQASMAASAALYGLIAPGSTGAKSISIAWTSAAEIHACAISFTGVNQTSVAVAFPHGNTNQANAGTSPCTVTITSATGNMVTASHAQNSSAWGAVSGTSLAPSDLVGPSIGVISNYDNGAATVTLTAAFPTTPSDRMSIGCDVLAAAGGGPVTPSSTSRLLMGVGI